MWGEATHLVGGKRDGQALGTRVSASDDVALDLEVEQTPSDAVHEVSGLLEVLDLQHQLARLRDIVATHLDCRVQPPI
jgi:hypothetical protein